jgi:hypothetical protein
MAEIAFEIVAKERLCLANANKIRIFGSVASRKLGKFELWGYLQWVINYHCLFCGKIRLVAILVVRIY